MASLLVSRAPQCLSCIRRMSVLEDALHVQTAQQIRGKKKVAKAITIKVKLRRDIAGFGRKGSIVPVPPGTMRNNWFPNKMAEYMTLASLKEIGDVVIERDPTFGGPKEREIAREKKAEKERVLKAREEAAAQIEAQQPLAREPRFEPEVLGPEQAMATLERLLPPTLEFYRSPIPAAPARKLSPSLAATSNISAAAEAAAVENAKKNPGKSIKTSIFGSVSTTDIAANLKAILWEDKDGARVVLSPEDISFVEEMEDKDRVKHLGTFGIVIRLGPSEIIRTKIEIKAQN